MPFVNEKNLFTLKMAGLKQALLQQPWIASVVIKRVWPDQITIDIVEQQPLAIWNDQALLAENATVFAAAKNTFPANLPQLYGPEGQQGNVWQQYQQFNQALQPLQLTVSRLVFNSRGSWQIVLNNGIALNLGRTELMPRLQRFIQVYPKLFANRVNQVVLIDLRYPAGLAVQWKTQLSSKE
jgi:cell division protein FtsQ